MHTTEEGVVQGYLPLSSNSKVGDEQGMLVPYSSWLLNRTTLLPSLPKGNLHFQIAQEMLTLCEILFQREEMPLWSFTCNLGPL